VFAFAGLWTSTRVGGTWIESCALLTRDAKPNKIAATVHSRMPVMLADEDAQHAWLDPELDAHAALELCGSLPDSRLSSRPANPAMNKSGLEDEGPWLLSSPETPASA
jgi:putative SOS response-associated peptidase YedK